MTKPVFRDCSARRCKGRSWEAFAGEESKVERCWQRSVMINAVPVFIRLRVLIRQLSVCSVRQLNTELHLCWELSSFTCCNIRGSLLTLPCLCVTGIILFLFRTCLAYWPSFANCVFSVPSVINSWSALVYRIQKLSVSRLLYDAGVFSAMSQWFTVDVLLEWLKVSTALGSDLHKKILGQD